MSDLDDGKALLRSVVGCRIVAARFDDAAPDDEWCEHEYAWLLLDDGRVIEFGSWGHDAWGATVSEAEGPLVDSWLRMLELAGEDTP